MGILAARAGDQYFTRNNNQRQFHCGRCSMKNVPSRWMCWNVRAAAAGCVFWPLLRICPSLARFSTVSVCPRGHPRLLPLAGSDTPNSPNFEPTFGLRRRVPLNRPLLLCAPGKRPCAPEVGILTLGIGYCTTPFPSFLDRPGTENRVHFSYVSAAATDRQPLGASESRLVGPLLAIVGSRKRFCLRRTTEGFQALF